MEAYIANTIDLLSGPAASSGNRRGRSRGKAATDTTIAGAFDFEINATQPLLQIAKENLNHRAASAASLARSLNMLFENGNKMSRADFADSLRTVLKALLQSHLTDSLGTANLIRSMEKLRIQA